MSKNESKYIPIPESGIIGVIHFESPTRKVLMEKSSLLQQRRLFFLSQLDECQVIVTDSTSMNVLILKDNNLVFKCAKSTNPNKIELYNTSLIQFLMGNKKLYTEMFLELDGDNSVFLVQEINEILKTMLAALKVKYYKNTDTFRSKKHPCVLNSYFTIKPYNNNDSENI